MPHVSEGASWGDLAAADPELAAKGRAILERSGHGTGLLATVRGDLPPRIHPMSVEIIDGHLLTVVLGGSAKAADITADGRYALHTHQDPARPDEFQVRGRASVVDDPELRARAVGQWHFEAGDEDLLVDLRIEHALLGERASADDWPPAYRSWRASRG
jgi:hypothetical protein